MPFGFAVDPMNKLNSSSKTKNTHKHTCFNLFFLSLQKIYWISNVCKWYDALCVPAQPHTSISSWKSTFDVFAFYFIVVLFIPRTWMRTLRSHVFVRNIRFQPTRFWKAIQMDAQIMFIILPLRYSLDLGPIFGFQIFVRNFFCKICNHPFACASGKVWKQSVWLMQREREIHMYYNNNESENI